jgi:hypothetical protein
VKLKVEGPYNAVEPSARTVSLTTFGDAVVTLGKSVYDKVALVQLNDASEFIVSDQARSFLLSALGHTSEASPPKFLAGRAGTYVGPSRDSRTWVAAACRS